jgi:hypothetical protein
VNNTFCFGLNISQFDLLNDQYEFFFMFPQLNLPSSNLPAYDYSMGNPNFNYFTDYEESGFLELYPIITRIILDEKRISQGNP